MFKQSFSRKKGKKIWKIFWNRFLKIHELIIKYYIHITSVTPNHQADII
jgi:hypothetical protein